MLDIQYPISNIGYPILDIGYWILDCYMNTSTISGVHEHDNCLFAMI